MIATVKGKHADSTGSAAIFFEFKPTRSSRTFSTRKPSFEGALGEIDRAMNGRLASLVASGELSGKALELVLDPFSRRPRRATLLLVGAGKKGKFSASDLRKIAGTALRYLKSRGAKKIAFLAARRRTRTAGCASHHRRPDLADFESDKYRTEKKPARDRIRRALRIRREPRRKRCQISHRRRPRDRRIANFARDLINEPSNRLTPRMLAARAEAMAKEVGLGIEILDERKIAELKMGALIGVAQGSTNRLA